MKKKPLRLLLMWVIVKIGESSSALQKSSFENLPTEVRLEIYRGLLLTEEEYVDPVTAGKHLSRSFGHQGSGKGLHVAILRCNKRIHGEANGVLYGENIFHSGLLSRLKFKLWHRFSMEEGSAVISSRCLRLITKVHLTIYLPDSFGVNEVVLAIDIVRRNLNDVASELALNDLTVLSIRFTNALTDGWFPTLRRMPETMDPSATSPFYGQECLEPLLEFRATSVSQLTAPIMQNHRSRLIRSR